MKIVLLLPRRRQLFVKDLLGVILDLDDVGILYFFTDECMSNSVDAKGDNPVSKLGLMILSLVYFVLFRKTMLLT